MSEHTGLVQRGALGIIVAVVMSLAWMGPVAAQQDPRIARDCSLPSTGKIPLIDLGADTYLGAQGGLYPQGSNTVPDSHLAVGLARAAQIEPLDASGVLDPGGAIVFASIGFSNPSREFAEFEPIAAQNPALVDAFQTVNLAQGGQHVLTWASPNGRPWGNVPIFLERAGFTAEQVQAVWMKQTQRVFSRPIEPFPNGAAIFRDALIDIVGLMHEEFPNLQIIYISSRVYGGWNDDTNPNPEPYAYEEGFGVKWLIEEQIAGNPSLNADPAAGEVVAPWLAWGPYLWADGTTPRSDGLTWPCNDFRASDGVHLNDVGNTKVAEQLMAFLDAEPTAAWAFTGRELPPAPVAAVPPPTSTIPGLTEAATTTAPTREREERRRTREGEDSAAPETTPPDTRVAPTEPPASEDAAARPSGRSEDALPPIVWALIGAGATLVVVGSGATLLRLRRRNAAAAAVAPPEKGPSDGP